MYPIEKLEAVTARLERASQREHQLLRWLLAILSAFLSLSALSISH